MNPSQRSLVSGFVRGVLLAGLALAISPATGWQGNEVPDLEKFVFAEDREKALDQLVPGSEDDFFYRALHAQNTGKLPVVAELLPRWEKAYGRTERWRSIRNRQALLNFGFDPAGSASTIRDELGLSFSHQRRIPPADRNLPSMLEPSLIDRERFIDQAIAQDWRLGRLSDGALHLLGERVAKFSPEQKRALLERLTAPDYPNLVPLVIEDLRREDSGGFGSLAIHSWLTLDQLLACRELWPDLNNNGVFVQQCVRLMHGPAVPLAETYAARRADLDRIHEFVRALPASQNSLKAAVLHELLALDRLSGKFDRALFVEYLKLPREGHWVHPRLLERLPAGHERVNLYDDFRSVLRCEPPGDELPLVEAALQHFLRDAANEKLFEGLVEKQFLAEQLATAQVLAGLGDNSRWAAILGAQRFRDLVERVDLEFETADQLWFGPDEKVTLSLRVKNVSEVIVRIHQLNPLNCFRATGAPISADMSLEGVVPNHQRTIARDEVPALCTVETVELPELSGRGIWVVDFIGGGKNCRALIHKGRLIQAARITTSGQQLTVLDEAGAICKPASVWIGDRQFESDDEGRISVPFTNEPGSSRVILEHDGFASLANLEQKAETWTLDVAAHIDRESLLPGQPVRLLIRPLLHLAGVPVPSKNIVNQLTATITATNLDGEPAVRNFRDLVVDENGEMVLEFPAPDRLRSLHLRLSGEARVASQSTTVTIGGETSVAVNGINQSSQIHCAHLLRTRDQFLLEVLGRNGEPVPQLPISISVTSRWSSEPVQAGLQTDDAGRVLLGGLEGIRDVRVTPGGGTEQAWSLDALEYQFVPATVTVPAGQLVKVPLTTDVATNDGGGVALFERRNGLFVRELPNAAAVEDGQVVIQPLEAGDYEIRFRDSGRSLTLWSVSGHRVAGQMVSPLQAATVTALNDLAVTGVEVGDQNATLSVRGASESTRIHVLASRYVPRFAAGRNLGAIQQQVPERRFFAWDGNRFVSARKLGDEYLYILNRQRAERMPGNMLARPSLLLQPWSLGPTVTQTEQLALDEQLDRGRGESLQGDASAGPGGGSAGSDADDFATLDYLEDGTILLANLRPNANGQVEIPLDKLGDKHHLTVVAVDLLATSQRSFSLAAKPLKTLDQRLNHPLAADQHFALQKFGTVQPAGQPFVLEDGLTGRFEALDDLGDAWRMLLANCGDGELPKFAQLMRWSELKDEEKQAFYAEHGCHEVNYFLFRKDRAFFDAVVKPLIADRHEPAFMDRWLLGEDLAEWTRPWRFKQLNVFEQILLAQRVESARPGILRQLDERWSLIPPDDVAIDQLFDRILASSSLEEDEKRKLTEDLSRSLSRNDPGQPTTGDPMPQSAAAPAMDMPAEGAIGGLGGGGGGRGAAPGMRPGAPARDADGADRRDTSYAEAESRSAERDAARQQLEVAEELFKKGSLSDKSVNEIRLGLEVLDQEAAQHYRFQGQDDFWAANEAANGKDGQNQQGLVAFYQAIKVTERWVESAWWRIPQTTSTADRIPVNRFWREYASHTAGEAFLSPSFVHCSANVSEVLLALAVLDLPEKAAEPEMVLDGRSIRWTAPGPAIVFHQQVAALDLDAGATRVMVSENLFDAADRYQMIDNRQADKFLTGPFHTGKLYGAQVVVTNPTSTPQSVSLLVQIPAGAIAVSGSRQTRTQQLELGAFASSSFEYWFYFPAAGKFSHYPAHVSDRANVLASAPAVELEVVAEREGADRGSWEFVSQNGSDDEVLAFLEKANLQNIGLDEIAFRMRDKAVFQRVTELLARRMTYNRTLWSYAVQHQAAAQLGEFLEHEEQFVATCGPALRSELLTIRPETRRWYEHTEFWPLVNARAHQVGARPRILNDQLFQQYVALLNTLSAQAELSADDRMAVVSYLLLQDRFGEAIQWFDSVNPEAVAGRMQYDYAAAWLALVRSQPAQAAELAARYVSCPQTEWRKKFAAITETVREINGETSSLVDPDNVAEQQARAAGEMASLKVASEGDELVIDWRNLGELAVSYFEIDVELMFSRDPFADQSASGQALVQPNLAETVVLAGQPNNLRHSLPEAMRKRNVQIEVRGGDQVATLKRLANDLDVQLVPALGQLQVRTRGEQGAFLPATYVKVYARMADGQVVFHKDGYTDLRGRFDYVTQSSQPLDNITEFAVLVLSDEHGCAIQTTGVPRR